MNSNNPKAPPAKMNSNGRKASPPTPPPAPAPRPPLPRKPIDAKSSKPAVETPSVYLSSLASMPADYLTRTVVEPILDQPYKPAYYFFYGTLTEPKILSHILDLKQPPVLRPAKLIGYALTNWGQYRALIDGKPGEEVTGYAYLVRSIDDELKLARYETNAYEPVQCRIRFTDGQSPAQEHGMTFKYAGDDEALKAGRFDRKLWELQMGTRLPDKWRARDTPSEK